jgi:hypothetical protein
MVRSASSGRTIWRCSKLPKLPGRQRACGGVSIGADNLEAEVVADTLAYVDQADYAEVAAQHEGDDDVRALVAELAQLEQDARETADLAAAGKIRPADFARYSSSVEAQQEALGARIGRLTAFPPAPWLPTRARWAPWRPPGARSTSTASGPSSPRR